MKQQLLIFTDLDGTLLDHHTYRFDAASQALAEIKARGYPLVLVSSKTAAELQSVQQQLGIRFPFVSENGAAVYWYLQDKLCTEVFAPDRQLILEHINRLRENHGYSLTGFSDCDVSEIVELTGLDYASAARAADREYTEPLLWQDTEQRFIEFSAQLASEGLRVLQGGRFRTVMGRYDKAMTMNYLKDTLVQDGPVITVALGDSPNDNEMLNNADIAVVIASAHSSKLSVSGPSWIIHTEKPGPEGWQQAMDQILNKYPAR